MGIIETRIIVIIFFFKGRNDRYFFVCIAKRIFKKTIDKSVAREAPIKPFELSKENKTGIGTKIEFSIRFRIAAEEILNIINFDLPNIEMRLLETINNAEIKDPINKNLSAVCAIRYCDPKRRFKATPGNKKIKIKTGKIIIKIHLFLLNRHKPIVNLILKLF